ncbi:MAG: hypothetical protein ABI191_02575 [Rhizomicrobium sp.]
MRWNRFVLLVALAGLCACSPAPPKSATPQADTAAAASNPAEPAPVKTAASHPILFHGYACTEGCLSHQQGYSWASAHGITNPNDCRGTSETFIEGCRAFAGIEGPFGGRIIDQSFPHALGSD